MEAKEELFFELLAPVPHPTSCRDGYAFRQHVAAARRNRKAEMIPQFDQYPIFYFTNHNAIQGIGEIECMPDHFEKLDFELEVAVALNDLRLTIGWQLPCGALLLGVIGIGRELRCWWIGQAILLPIRRF